ncbi:hypothetical protein [Latilactobacillus graminis]|uniref:Uncharacterized protein n=2 Tax=Latilactobacillus graminis TaxID=60519 RepID=A0AA89I1U6_9LACO|nr:hypothetical protein [Latilactobacillus graminis]KRM23910.1 hypothetical protein FC90_GL001149 [Latilactobacillus graminis DSM 20719]QFP79923.1 hypothetical protein LG542_06525 [Latilactobacillus graminis]
MISNLWSAFKAAFFFLSTILIAKIIFKWSDFHELYADGRLELGDVGISFIFLGVYLGILLLLTLLIFLYLQLKQLFKK